MSPRELTTADRHKILEGHFLFGELPEADRETLVTYSRLETYRDGETIFLKGSPGRGMMAVLRGEVRISAPSSDGREIVLNIIRPGEIFGEIALLDGKDRSANAEAIGNCVLFVIERRDFLPFIEKRPGLALRLLAMMCERLRRTTQQVEDLLFLDLPARLAKQLLDLTPPGRTAAETPFRIPAKISQGELGHRIGVSRESINRQLGKWQQEGILELQDGAIRILNGAALQELVDTL